MVPHGSSFFSVLLCLPSCFSRVSSVFVHVLLWMHLTLLCFSGAPFRMEPSGTIVLFVFIFRAKNSHVFCLNHCLI